MIKPLVTILLLFAIHDISYSQTPTCPTYDKRTNGNNAGNCSPDDASNKGIYSDKTGHFAFSTGASNFSVSKVYYNNTLIQNGSSVVNGSDIFFGNIIDLGNNSQLCF